MLNYLNKLFYIVIASSFLVFGCEDVILTEELNAIDSDRVWNDERLTTLYLNGIYNSLLPGFAGTANVSLSDESYGPGPEQIMYGLFNGTINNASYGPYGVGAYGNIRDINVLLQDIETGSLSKAVKDKIKGQAYFLRAWQYWQLVLHHGGVPIILEPIDINGGDEVILNRRRSAEYCIDVIVQDLDSAIALAPPGYSDADYGRVTQSAAAALKGRVLLFFASPQFVPDGFSNADGIASRWEAAYQANKMAREICEENGHALYPDFERIFLDEDNQEAIFVSKYDGGNRVHEYENSVRPGSASNINFTTANPNWEFVKSFPMEDGVPIDESDGYDSTLYWVSRDPRLYATVAYNGSYWEFPERANTINRQWSYQGNNQEGNANTATGFYVRKNVNNTLLKSQTVQVGTDWIEMRFAEVLLNLAECAVEVGQNQEAKDLLILIRERAGILPGDGAYGLPDVSASKLEWRKTVMNERKIELAYENKRHWDMRRRNLYENNLNAEKGEGLNGTVRTSIQIDVDRDQILALWPDINTAENPDDSAFVHFERYVRDTVNWEIPSNHDLYFDITFSVPLEIQVINYLPAYNFYLLPQNSLDRNPLLQQTVGWMNGTFDPLAQE